ncbi:rRNA maturation RNase YbeY [Patescibacteria group bacterium]
MIEINNTIKTSIDTEWLREIAEKVLKGEKKEQDLSIALISPEKIKEANKKYLGKDKPTDILSFSSDDLGEIVICPEIVKENAKGSFEEELTFVLIHGILHILGYDHGEQMKEKEHIYLHGQK